MEATEEDELGNVATNEGGEIRDTGRVGSDELETGMDPAVTGCSRWYHRETEGNANDTEGLEPCNCSLTVEFPLSSSAVTVIGSWIPPELGVTNTSLANVFAVSGTGKLRLKHDLASDADTIATEPSP